MEKEVYIIEEWLVDSTNVIGVYANVDTFIEHYIKFNKMQGNTFKRSNLKENSLTMLFDFGEIIFYTKKIELNKIIE